MTRRVVNVGSEAVLFSSDGQPPPADRTWALVRARVVDELTGEPPQTRMTVETDRTDINTRAAAARQCRRPCRKPPPRLPTAAHLLRARRRAGPPAPEEHDAGRRAG